MIKQIKNLKGIILAIFLLLSFISVAKVKVNIDGTVNINFGKSKDRDRNSGNGRDYWDHNGYDSVGDITDDQYNMKPFILNGKGYSVIRDRGRLYLLQVEFYNSDPNRVKNERIFNTNTYSSNCLAIAGDNRYCITVTSEGSPALWDRYSSRVKYTGRWLKPNNTYYDYNYDYDYYNNSNQDWFEW